MDRLGDMRERNSTTSLDDSAPYWVKDNFVQTGMTSNAVAERMHPRIIILKS